MHDRVGLGRIEVFWPLCWLPLFIPSCHEVRCSNEPLESSGWTRTESPGFRVYQVVIVQDYLRYQFTDHHRVCGTDRLPRDANPFGAFNIKYRSLIDKQKQSRQKGKAGKLYCCFVDFRKAFDTVPHAVLWQVLEELGVHRQNPGHHQVSVCTRQRSSAVITRHFCHPQMSHGGEARVSAESNSVWFVC